MGRGKHGPPLTPKCPQCREYKMLTVMRLTKAGTDSWHTQRGRALARVRCERCGHTWDSRHPQIIRRARRFAGERVEPGGE